jgi:predicted deacylase
VSHLAVNNELCSGKKCKFVYYEYFSPGRIEKDRNRTVLLVSGMHGNEYLGPHTLLYGYQHFEAAHIIYFPVANPSGFAVN